MATSICERPTRELARFGNVAVTESGIVGQDVLLSSTFTVYDIQCAFLYARAHFGTPKPDSFDEHEPVVIGA